MTLSRYIRTLVLLAAALLMGAEAPGVLAQPQPAAPADSGTVVLTDWPAAAQEPVEPGREYPFELLPFIDALSVDYRYGVVGGPQIKFTLSWLPGTEGILERERVSYDRLPEDIRIERLHLRADVLVDGRDVTDLLVRVDSLMLPPRPDTYAFLTALDWATLFADTPADSAQAYFDQGFTLANLRIEHIAFAVFEPRPAQENVYRDRRPSPPRIYPVDIDIYVDWFFPRGRDYVRRGGDNDRPRSGVTRTRDDRDDDARDGARTVTREPGDTGRDSNDRSRNGATEEQADDDDDDREGRGGWERFLPGNGEDDDDDEEDEEDETSLAPAAIGAAVAVGALVFVGGTVGVYGNSGDLPIGLQAGYVRPNGGIVLQAAVNDEVLTDGDGERLVAKVTGFRNLFDAPVQPAVGLGVLARAQGDDYSVEPTFSLGLVANLGRVLLMTGYDVQARGVDFGLAFNFRYRPPEGAGSR